METIDEIRRNHFLQAIAEFRGSQEDLADAVGMSPSYLSQLKTGTRNIGPQTVRLLEDRLGYPRGSWDTPPPVAGLQDALDGLTEEQVVEIIVSTLDVLGPDSVRKLSLALLKHHSEAGSE